MYALHGEGCTFYLFAGTTTSVGRAPDVSFGHRLIAPPRAASVSSAHGTLTVAAADASDPTFIPALTFTDESTAGSLVNGAVRGGDGKRVRAVISLVHGDVVTLGMSLATLSARASAAMDATALPLEFPPDLVSAPVEARVRAAATRTTFSLAVEWRPLFFSLPSGIPAGDDGVRIKSARRALTTLGACVASTAWGTDVNASGAGASRPQAVGALTEATVRTRARATLAAGVTHAVFFRLQPTLRTMRALLGGVTLVTPEYAEALVARMAVPDSSAPLPLAADFAPPTAPVDVSVEALNAVPLRSSGSASAAERAAVPSKLARNTSSGRPLTDIWSNCSIGADPARAARVLCPGGPTLVWEGPSAPLSTLLVPIGVHALLLRGAEGAAAVGVAGGGAGGDETQAASASAGATRAETDTQFDSIQGTRVVAAGGARRPPGPVPPSTIVDAALRDFGGAWSEAAAAWRARGTGNHDTAVLAAPPGIIVHESTAFRDANAARAADTLEATGFVRLPETQLIYAFISQRPIVDVIDEYLSAMGGGGGGATGRPVKTAAVVVSPARPAPAASKPARELDAPLTSIAHRSVTLAPAPSLHAHAAAAPPPPPQNMPLSLFPSREAAGASPSRAPTRAPGSKRARSPSLHAAENTKAGAVALDSNGAPDGAAASSLPSDTSWSNFRSTRDPSVPAAASRQAAEEDAATDAEVVGADAPVAVRAPMHARRTTSQTAAVATPPAPFLPSFTQPLTARAAAYYADTAPLHATGNKPFFKTPPVIYIALNVHDSATNDERAADAFSFLAEPQGGAGRSRSRGGDVGGVEAALVPGVRGRSVSVARSRAAALRSNARADTGGGVDAGPSGGVSGGGGGWDAVGARAETSLLQDDGSGIGIDDPEIKAALAARAARSAALAKAELALMSAAGSRTGEQRIDGKSTAGMAALSDAIGRGSGRAFIAASDIDYADGSVQQHAPLPSTAAPSGLFANGSFRGPSVPASVVTTDFARGASVARRRVGAPAAVALPPAPPSAVQDALFEPDVIQIDDDCVIVDAPPLQQPAKKPTTQRDADTGMPPPAPKPPGAARGASVARRR